MLARHDSECASTIGFDELEVQRTSEKIPEQIIPTLNVYVLAVRDCSLLTRVYVKPEIVLGKHKHDAIGCQSSNVIFTRDLLDSMIGVPIRDITPSTLVTTLRNVLSA